MSKITLIDAIYAIPDVLNDRIFGEFPEIPVPETEEDAIIAMGKFSAYVNNSLLMPLSGLDLVELLLRVGQRSSPAIAAVLANLEVISGDGGGKLTVISPTDGGVYPNWFDGFVCSGKGIASVTVDADGTAFTLTADGDTWSAELTTPMNTGKHTATFTATFQDDSTMEQTVSFETTANMELVATFPENETSYLISEIDHIDIELSEEAAAENESLTVTIFDYVLQPAIDGVHAVAEIGEIGIDWIGLNAMTVKNVAGEIMGTITFLINPPEAE